MTINIAHIVSWLSLVYTFSLTQHLKKSLLRTKVYSSCSSNNLEQVDWFCCHTCCGGDPMPPLALLHWSVLSLLLCSPHCYACLELQLPNNNFILPCRLSPSVNPRTLVWSRFLKVILQSMERKHNNFRLHLFFNLILLKMFCLGDVIGMAALGCIF